MKNKNDKLLARTTCGLSSRYDHRHCCETFKRIIPENKPDAIKPANGYKLAREPQRKEETHSLIEFSRYFLLNPYTTVASRNNRFLSPYKSLYFQGYATMRMINFRASATCACTSSILSAFAVTRKNTDACVLYMSAKLSLTNNRRFNSRTKQFHLSLSYRHFVVHSTKKS